MRFAETSQSSDTHAARPTSRRLFSLVLPLLVAALSFTPGGARADTPAPLPQGFTTDDGSAASATGAGEFQETQADADVTVVVGADEYVDTDPAALSDFRDPLTPYGVWVDDPTYGTVWVPSSTVVGSDFAPYQTSGHWELDSNDDWMWVSDYDWGSIPFHYGRWVFIGGRGWSWIPGRTYAPAWVSWRTTEYGYLGWAPMAPSWYWFGGSPVTVWVTPPSAYVFCPSAYVFHHHMHSYVVRDHDIVRRIGAHSRPYHPAHPSAGHGSSARAYRPASPSLAEAKVPAGSAPKQKSAPDARAVAYSRRSTTAQARQMSREERSLPATIAPNRGGSREDRDVHAGRTPESNHGTRQPRVTSPRIESPSVQPTPQPRTNHPSVTPAPSRPSVSPSRPSVSPSRPSVSPSRPSVSPSRPSVSPSRPSVSPSRPSVSPSRPSVSPSRPSFSPSRPSGGSHSSHRR